MLIITDNDSTTVRIFWPYLVGVSESVEGGWDVRDGRQLDDRKFLGAQVDSKALCLHMYLCQQPQ